MAEGGEMEEGEWQREERWRRGSGRGRRDGGGGVAEGGEMEEGEWHQEGVKGA